MACVSAGRRTHAHARTHARARSLWWTNKPAHIMRVAVDVKVACFNDRDFTTCMREKSLRWRTKKKEVNADAINQSIRCACVSVWSVRSAVVLRPRRRVLQTNEGSSSFTNEQTNHRSIRRSIKFENSALSEPPVSSENGKTVKLWSVVMSSTARPLTHPTNAVGAPLFVCVCVCCLCVCVLCVCVCVCALHVLCACASFFLCSIGAFVDELGPRQHTQPPFAL